MSVAKQELANNPVQRFLTAQDKEMRGYTIALAEMQNGKKISHWIWYIFPQIKGLGQTSDTAIFYAIKDAEEACNYLRNAILFDRYYTMVSIVNIKLTTINVNKLMGSEIDVRKLISSLTLFRAIALYLYKLKEPLVDHSRLYQLWQHSNNILLKLDKSCEDTLQIISNLPEPMQHQQKFIPMESNPHSSLNLLIPKQTHIKKDVIKALATKFTKHINVLTQENKFYHFLQERKTKKKAALQKIVNMLNDEQSTDKDILNCITQSMQTDPLVMKGLFSTRTADLLREAKKTYDSISATCNR